MPSRATQTRPRNSASDFVLLPPTTGDATRLDSSFKRLQGLSARPSRSPCGCPTIGQNPHGATRIVQYDPVSRARGHTRSGTHRGRPDQGASLPRSALQCVARMGETMAARLFDPVRWMAEGERFVSPLLCGLDAIPAVGLAHTPRTRSETTLRTERDIPSVGLACFQLPTAVTRGHQLPGQWSSGMILA